MGVLAVFLVLVGVVCARPLNILVNPMSDVYTLGDKLGRTPLKEGARPTTRRAR